MECPNCQFQNVPGLSACVRCGSGLMFDDTPVEPPRAPKSRLLRRVLGIKTNSTMTVRHWGTSVRCVITRRLPDMSSVDWGAAGWSLIPGLGHIKRGRRVEGRVYLSVWCTAAVLCVLTFGTLINPWLYSALLIIHGMVIAAFFVVAAGRRQYAERVIWGLVILVLLNFVVYTPAVLAAQSSVRWVRLTNTIRNPVVANGDVMLYSGWLMRPRAFRRGDLVVYRIPAAAASGVILHEGLGVDRIVGLPGDKMRFQDGQVYVNDELLPGEEYPLNGVPKLALSRREIEVPENTYMILPSLLPMHPNVFWTVSMVHADRIQGRVLGRFNRWWRLESMEQRSP